MSETKFSLPEVSSIDDVPDEYRPFYFEKEGKIQRQDPMAMKKTIDAVRREKDQLAKELMERDNRLGAFVDALGDDADPDYIKGLKEKAAKAEQLPTNDEVEKRIRLVEENYKKQQDLLKKELDQREKTIEKVTIASQLRDALKAADANEDGLDILPEILRKRVEKQYLDNGEVQLIPLDEDGTRMYADDGSDATLVDLANKFREKRPIFFNGSRASGMGTTGEQVVISKDQKNWFKMNDGERMDFRKKHGQQKTNALIAQSARA